MIINDIRTDALSVQVNEDECLALAAVRPLDTSGGGPWVVGADTASHLDATTVFRPGEWSGRLTHGCSTQLAGDDALPVARYIARHDPRRERAEVALKRLILEQHKPGEPVSEWVSTEKRKVETVPCLECSFLPSNFTDADPEYVEWPCDYIRALEAIYTETVEGMP